MNLIGRNKIAEYILKHREARVALLTFLKEFPYRADLYLSHNSINASCNVDGFDCIIKVQINHFAKAINIIQLSNRAEEMKIPAQGEITKTVTVTVTAPLLPGLEEVIEFHERKLKEIKPSLFNPESADLSVQQGEFYTKAEYEQCLDRATEIFDAKPEVPEFEELQVLLTQIHNYEEYRLEFPKLKIFEVIKHRLELFSITPAELRYIIGSDDLVNLFLSGKLALADDVLTRLYGIVGLRAPVTDQRFL